jgi:hypothetical protein
MRHTWAMIFGKDLLQPKRTSVFLFFFGVSVDNEYKAY